MPRVVCSLPYRMVFAVATEDAVMIYDTQQPQPFAYITNIHYHTLSDLSWLVYNITSGQNIRNTQFADVTYVILTVKYFCRFK